MEQNTIIETLLKIVDKVTVEGKDAEAIVLCKQWLRSPVIEAPEVDPKVKKIG